MTGTADTEAQEFQQIYDLEVIVIPPHKKMIRKDYGDLVYLTMIEKYNAKLFIFPNLMIGPHKILGNNMDTYNIKNFKLVKNKL